VTDSILLYWNRQDQLKIVSDRYESFRLESRRIGWKVFEWYPFNYSIARSEVLKSKPDLWMKSKINNVNYLYEYMNVVSSCYSTVKPNFIGQLNTAMRVNRNLSKLIKKKYHL
jgi:hypothetical protein